MSAKLQTVKGLLSLARWQHQVKPSSTLTAAAAAAATTTTTTITRCRRIRDVTVLSRRSVSAAGRATSPLPAAADRPRALQTTTDDADRRQRANNTGPLGGPVINNNKWSHNFDERPHSMERIFHGGRCSDTGRSGAFQ